MKRLLVVALSSAMLLGLAFGAAQAKDIKIALILDKTGPLEAYAKQTEAGFTLGLDYATQGTLTVAGRKITVVTKDSQTKPDQGKALLAAAFGDEDADLAVGPTSSGTALAMLPVAEEYKKVLVVEPAVADAITGAKWNRYIFRTARNSTQDALAGAATIKGQDVSIATLAQDYAFGHDGIAALKEALAAVTGGRAKVVFEEYAPITTTDFTASAQRLFDALKDKPGRKIIAIAWAGPSPFTKLADLQPERYGIELAPGGNLLPIMASWKKYTALEGAIYYYYKFPKNAANDWLVTEYKKRFNRPPDFFDAGGMAAAMAVVAALKATDGSTDSEKLIAAMEGMSFDTPKGQMTFRKDDHQALQVMYHWHMKKDPTDEDPIELVNVIPIEDMPLPIRNKR
jgi:branched-chain amino acid transport system substrate-binding protein